MIADSRCDRMVRDHDDGGCGVMGARPCSSVTTHRAGACCSGSRRRRAALSVRGVHRGNQVERVAWIARGADCRLTVPSVAAAAT